MNVVTLIGNLATEVELREVGPDKRVASFVLGEGGSPSTGGSSPARGRTTESGGARSKSSPRRVEFLGGGPRRAEEEEGGEVIPFEAPAAV